MVGLMSVWKLIFLILWSIGFLIFTSCVKAPTYEFDLQLYQVDETLLECPTGWLKFRNQCYYIVQEEATFQQADILCKRYGGHLVKTDGYNNNQGIGKLISNHNISNVWIGLQRKKSGEFWWSDGQQAEAADGFWTTQLPIKSTEYDLCTVMTTTLSDNGEYRWTLSNCDIGYSSVCQTSACVAGQFRCSDGSGCISRSWICDGIHQCSDRSDELMCPGKHLIIYCGQCSDRSDELMCPGSCGGHLQGILQTFHSPHYPQTYPKYSSCIWRLETPVGTRVHLKFESFAVETLYDKVIIHDGSSEKDPLVGTYSGTDKPSVPYSSSNFYLVIFQSDQENQMSGFNASFSAVPMDKCGSEMIASSISQWFGSPNFPNSYPNNILCEWIIKTDNSVDLISLQFHSFSLDTSDFIEIRQGESIDSPLYGRFTGEDIPPVFISTSHSFFIRLYTDFTHTGTGFNATYKTGCNNTILQGYARIMSPGYGITKYPNSINCDWTISDPLQRNLSLVFNNNFDTEKGFDNVTVYTNNHTSYTHAGQGAPPAITTQSEHFHVNFSSDSQVNRNGWAITVSFDCPTLNLSDHLQTNSSITTFGTYVLFYCDNGYQLAGTSVLICDIGGRWSTSPPTCNVINCGSPSIPVNTKLVSVSSTSYLGTAVYKCNSGYKMSTNDTSICQSNRQWSTLYCTEISCPKLDMTEKLMLKFTTSESHYVYGDIVIYDCDSNYRLIGASMVYCTENGTWSKPTPSCKSPVCPPVYIRNGYTNATNIVVGGDFLQVDCNNGYSLTGNPMVFCDLNGVYTALPYCSDINECETGNVCGGHTCQNTPGSYRCVCNRGYQNPPNSYTVCKDTDECSSFPCTGICENLNGKYRCNCNPPQELYTENIIRIVKRKVLRPNSTCIAVCPSFNVSNGGVIVADTVPLSSGNYIAPTTVKIHCPRGTVPDGSVVVECQLDGTWNNTVTKCINHECERLLAPDNGGIFYLNGTRGYYNSVVQYSCKEGYELSGVQYRFCQPVNDTKQFEWTGIEPVCKELKCPALPDPANGQAMYGSTTVGSILQYSCNCGYHLIGSKVRKCQSGGLWDGRNAICAPSTVCQSPVSSGSVVMSNVSPFYTVGTEVSFQCKKPGYEIADTTPIKCVLERPTENKRPQYNLMFEMKFLTPGNFNKSCDSHYVNETVEMFKDLVEQTCKDPYRPLTTIKTLVTSGDILQIDLIIQLSEPREGSFDLVCNCSTALTEIVSSGLIQNNINNVTFNGSEDTTCPTVRLRAADRDNITSTSNWSCDEGYDLVHHSEICVKDPEPTCVKSTDCPNVYVPPTTTASTTRITPTFSPVTTTQWNFPISPVNQTTNELQRSTAISTARSPLETFTMTQTAEITTVSETDGKRETTKLTSVVQDTTHRTPTVPGVSKVTSTEPSVVDKTEVTTAIIRTTQMTPTVPVVSEIPSTEPSILNKTELTTANIRTTQKTATPKVTTEQQTSDHHITDRNTTDYSSQLYSTEKPIENTGHSLPSTEPSDSVTTQKSATDPFELETTKMSITEPSKSVTTQESITEPSKSVTTLKSATEPSESRTTQKSATEPSESRTTQKSATEPSESRTTQKSATEPSESRTTQKSATEPSESRTTQKSATEPSESRTTQKSATEPSESRTTQKSATEPSESTSTQKSATELFTENMTTVVNDTEKFQTLSHTTYNNSEFTTQRYNETAPTNHQPQPTPTIPQRYTTETPDNATINEITARATDDKMTTAYNYITKREDIGTTSAGRKIFTDDAINTTQVPTQTQDNITRREIQTPTQIQDNTTEQVPVTQTELQDNTTVPAPVTQTQLQDNTTSDSQLTTQPSITTENKTENVMTTEKTTQSMTETEITTQAETTTMSQNETELQVSQAVTEMVTNAKTTANQQPTSVKTTADQEPTTVKTTTDQQPITVKTTATQPNTVKTTADPEITTQVLTTPGITIPTTTAPKYVIEMTAVLIPANLSQPCKENINTAISDILSSTAGVSSSLQNTKTCSKYNIKVFIETAINMTISTVKVTKKYSLVGQTQAILTPCGQDIDDKLLLELRESLSNLPSQTICLQSLQETSITASLWKCSDGYVMDSSGELCHIVTLTTDSVTIGTTTAVVSATTVPTKEVTPEVTTAVITVPSTTISSTTTTPTTTTTMKPTTQGTTLPPTSAAFYLIQVEAVFTGTNLTWDGCIAATRTQIEEKVESISTSIIKGLTKDWKQCTKQSDIVLLSQTGKIAVTPERLKLKIQYPSVHRLELTAPFAIQSPSIATNIVTDCASNGVQGHINAKFHGLLQEINPGVCYVTLQTFEISFSDWSCNDNYEYDPTSEICLLIQTTKSPTTTPSPLNTLMASDIKYFIPHGTLSLSIQFIHLSIQNEGFCLTEYRNRLVSLMQSQTSLFNNGNMVDVKKYCADIYISLYGTDSMAEDVVLSVSPGMVNGEVAVKFFATSSSFTSNASYNSCIGWIASELMNVSSHALIGQSTLPSSNATLCSNVTLNNISITNVAFDCTTGYQKALYNSYFLCLRDDRTKYIAPLLLSYQWHQLSSEACINSLMTRLSAESIPFVQQYAKQPSCPSDIVLQQNGTVTSSFTSNYSHGNITIAYELSSQTETAGSISTFSSCAVTILPEARTYFEQKSAEIFSSEKVIESCGLKQPVVTMPVVSGHYICPNEKTWDQIKNQCINADGRKKRKKRSALLTGMNREKRSVEVLTTTTAFWNSSVPNCIDVKPPVFQNCPTKDIIVIKELWGPVFVNISQPIAVDNSGISPKITITPEDFRQPYLFRENTTVTFTAQDGSGNSEPCEIHVILIDTHPLTIRCPVDVVYVPYATSSDVVNITYNSIGVVASSSATHITYQPPLGTSIKIKEHVEVKATAHGSNGNTVACNFTYEATRDDQIPKYKIKVVYSVTNVHSYQDDCPKKYGTELFHKIQNLSVAVCSDSFMLLPSITLNQDVLVVDISVMFMNFKTLDFDCMKLFGNLSAQKMIDAGNLTLAPSGCEELELIFIEEETTQDYLCESNFTVLNRTSKYCTYCHKGTFSNQTSGQCEVCPVTQDIIPRECMPCTEDSSVCLDLCKPGEYSPTGLQPCTKCSFGTYTDTYNSTICQSCPPGNSTLSTGTNSLHGCIDECPIGSYSHTGLIPCQPCPQMFYSDTTRSKSCTECPPDQVTASTGSSAANQCYDPQVCSNDICNNGTCMPMDSGRHFVCDCLPGFIGGVCDVNLPECDSNPCVNGDCVDGVNSYSCTCYQGYTGHNCEISINDCSLNTCSNGTCIDGVNSSSCLCYDGFTGDSSCVEKTECDPNTCEHGGLCIDLIDDFICNCSGTGYVGKNCSMLPERCYNGSCLNDGVCHPHVSGYSCSCAQGYTGEYCQINIDECQGHYCRNQAVCVDGVNSYTCLCQPGYNGSHCNYNTMCDTSPCVNGASCQTTPTGFVCNCLLGYSGVLCEINVDECKQNNCNPDTSQCVDQINSYTCNCLPGWTGEFCDEPTNECLSSPCAHRSQCFDHENQFSCSCVDGYTGHNCSTQVIECDSHPCYNDGQCLDQVNGYRCTCKGSFTGSQCEKHIDLCVGSPCLHNGTCQELVDTFLCKCEVGWAGSRCESLIDNCVSLPCYNNAVCINGINQYTCVCKPGYTGSHCQMDIDECLTDPCLHEGVCTNLIGGYYCTCPDGYTGTDCADLDIPCPSCQNGAIECFNGECVCLPGFIGPDCGKEVNPDFDLYFHGNSRIDTGVKRIKNRNQFSVCLWYKAFGLMSSMPVLTLVAVNGNREDDVLSIYSDCIHLSYFRQTEFNISVTPRSWNHLCVTWDSHDSGHWSVYINGWIQVEGNEFGNGQELPKRQKLVFGQATEDSNSTFHGMISQVNLYDTVLNESEITKGGKNCSISMPVGSVFRWQEFTSYISTETAGVNVIEPSLCGSDECPLSYEGEWCNTTEDTEAPTVIYCPEYVQVVTANRLNIVNWTVPQFTDNVGIINVVQTHRSGQVFAYGEYDVMYIAYDTENNTAICSFTVYVIPFNCSLPAPPSNVILTCSTWPEGLQCSVKCQDPRIQSFVEEVPSFYKCGREGFWDPPRGREFNFPTCAESSSPDGTIKGELVYLGPPCTLSSKQILNESFVKNMNNWNMEFGLCPEIGCNFSNITILCMSSGKRRRRSTKSTYNVTFDIPVNGSLMSDGVNALPLTQLETMIKNEEFNTDDFSCDAEKLVVKPYIKCQTGQILVDTICVNCIRGTYYDNTNELCGVCPVGQYTDQERQTTCKSCALGYTTESSGTTSSTLCYKTCNIGNYYDKRLLDCKPCERGYYQDETGKTTCKSCGNGQTTENTGSTSVTYCQNSCRAGTELSVSGTCELCAQGTYKSDDSQDTCQPCPYGFSTQNKGATSVQQCSVVSCPPDYKYDSTTEKCVVCPPGYHQPYQGQSSCIPCTKFDSGITKCSTGEIDECAIHQDNCDDNAECKDTTDSFECQCKFGFKGNGTTCIDKCIGACYGYIACIIDNSGEPQCKQDTSDTFPLIAVAGGGASFVLIIILMIVVGVCRRRSNQKKRKETPHNYQHMDRVHRELEVVTYPRGLPRTVQFRNNPAYSDSDLSDPTAYHSGQASAPIWARPVFPDHEDLSKYSETSLKRPLRLRITQEMKNDQQFEIESNKSWHDSSPGSSLSQYRDDTHHSSPNSSISKYRVDSNPKDSSPSSSISQYKEDSLHKNDSPISNKSDFSDSFF
ncbi:uncharacterized protein [Mytilus edulis]|uniref:uncharacterized protein n=1 Tax=Mytilus edulis TaxID=6550 RepID=UPI0039EE3B89